MARTINEIKQAMTADFIADTAVVSRYGLDTTKSFDEQFSRLSMESVIFYIVAVAIYAFECILDLTRQEIDDVIAESVPATVGWYRKIALEYQEGVEMAYDQERCRYYYESIDPKKQIVKYAAVRESEGQVTLLVSAATGGVPAALSDEQLTAFRAYVRERKPAGIMTTVDSYPPDEIAVTATVTIDKTLLAADGSLLANSGVKPVEDAISGYLAAVKYGGVLSQAHLTAAILAATGVTDADLSAVEVKSVETEAFELIADNNYTSVSGSFKPAAHNITYQ